VSILLNAAPSAITPAPRSIAPSLFGDDKSIICHSQDYLYETTLDGQVLSKMPLGDIMNKSYLSGTTKILFSRDRRYLLFATTRIPGQNTAIYIFDIEKRVRSRVTPETINASEPQWLPSEKEVLFLQLRENQKVKIRFDVSKISLDGSNLVTLIENARSVSYSRQ
jgi:Tol biopolymer transport system component